MALPGLSALVVSFRTTEDSAILCRGMNDSQYTLYQQNAAGPLPLVFFPLHRSHAASLPPSRTYTNRQTFGKKKTATAVAHVKAGKGLIKVNGSPITLVQPEILRFKVYEPLTLAGLDKFQNIDIRVKVTGGGHVSQVYAIRQAIAKGLVAYHQKYVDEASKNELKKIFSSYDKTLLVADSRRMEPKKFGGRGARARFQKSYR